MGIATKEYEIYLSLRDSPEKFRITYLGLGFGFTVWMRCTIEVTCLPLSRHLKTEKVRGGQQVLYSWVQRGSLVTAVVSDTEQRTRSIVRRVPVASR